MRLFLAINLSPASRRAIHAATRPLRDVAPSLAWVREPLLHLTLKFLGDQTDDRLHAIGTCLATVAARHAELVMELGGLGAFPNFRRARTVWFGITPQPRLELLHHDIETGFGALGFEVEGRPFRPHLTLARVKSPDEDLMRVLSREAKKVDYREEVVVRSVDLMKSDLTPMGSHYTILTSASLRSS